MSDDERGGIGVALAIIGAAIVLMFVGFDACIDDDDEKDDLGQGVELLVAGGNRDCGGDESCRPGSDDCAHASAECSDDDFSPTFDKSPVEDSFNVQVCVTPGSCTAEPDPS